MKKKPQQHANQKQVLVNPWYQFNLSPSICIVSIILNVSGNKSSKKVIDMRQPFSAIIPGHAVAELYTLTITYIYLISHVNNWRKRKIMELMAEFGKFLTLNSDTHHFEDWFVNVFLTPCTYYFLSEHFIW